MRVHPRAGAEQAQQQGLARHFQGKHAHNFLIGDGGILGDVHREGGFAHGGPGRDDDEIRALQAAGHFIQIGVVRSQSGNPLSALQERVNGTEGLLYDLLHSHEAASNALLRKLENGGFGIIQNFFGRVGLIAGARNSGIRGMDESAQQRFIADNLDVVLNAGPIGDAIDQPRNVTDIAD